MAPFENDSDKESDDEPVPAVRWIENEGWNPRKFAGPRLLRSEAQQAFLRTVMNSFQLSEEAATSFQDYNPNELSKVCVFFSAVVPDLTCYRSAGLKEVMESFEQYNWSANDVEELAEIHKANLSVICNGEKAEFVKVLESVEIETLALSGLAEGSPFEENMPVISFLVSDLVLKLNKPTLEYLILRPIKIASYAGLVREKAGASTLIYHHFQDAEHMQSMPMYATQSGWTGTTDKDLSELLEIGFLDLQFDPKVVTEMQMTANAKGFEKELLTKVVALLKLNVRSTISPINETIGKTMRAAKKASTRFIEVNQRDDLYSFGALLLTHADHESKGVFSLLIAANHVQLYKEFAKLLRVMRTNYFNVPSFDVMAKIRSVGELTTGIKDLFPVMLVEPCCLLNSACDQSWKDSFKFTVSTSNTLDVISSKMLNVDEIWEVRNADDLHVGYHMTSKTEKTNPGSVFNLDGSVAMLDGTRFTKITQQYKLHEPEKHVESCTDISRNSAMDLQTIEMGVKKTYSKKVQFLP